LEREKELTWWCHQKEEEDQRWMSMEEDEPLARHYESYNRGRESIREEGSFGIR